MLNFKPFTVLTPKLENGIHYYHPKILDKYLCIDKIEMHTMLEIEKLFLVRFLKYTENLELNVVNKVFKKMLGATDGLRVKSLEEERLVLQFIMEEEVHAELAHSLFYEVSKSSLLTFHKANPDEHLCIIEDLNNDKDLTEDEIQFLFVFASETLISKRLSYNCANIILKPVRDYMKMHMREESAHRQYFLNKFNKVFNTWNHVKQMHALDVITECIITFLKQDILTLKYDLAFIDCNPDLVRSSINEEIADQAEFCLQGLSEIISRVQMNKLINNIKIKEA